MLLLKPQTRSPQPRCLTPVSGLAFQQPYQVGLLTSLIPTLNLVALSLRLPYIQSANREHVDHCGSQACSFCYCGQLKGPKAFNWEASPLLNGRRLKAPAQTSAPGLAVLLPSFCCRLLPDGSAELSTSAGTAAATSFQPLGQHFQGCLPRSVPSGCNARMHHASFLDTLADKVVESWPWMWLKSPPESSSP